jgi:peptidoglycan/xylan/chitin deacetylase (PgdA/CDA1 family)
MVGMSLRHLPRRREFRAAVATVLVLAPMLVAAELEDAPAPLAVTVDGRPALVAHDATLGDAIRELELRAVPGKLLDVEGEVLDRRADPGTIRLNELEVPRTTALADGDTISVRDGEDRVEGTLQRVERLPGRQVGNPMYTLAIAKTNKVTTFGQISGKVVSVRFETEGKPKYPPAVALTFDDGPWPKDTLRVLRILRDRRVPATFFMVGYLIERYPEIVRRVERAGMTIGTHSWSHPYLTPFVDLTPHRIQTEIERPAELLREGFGIETTLFRAPAGSYDRRVLRLARDAGMRLVQWSVDPDDYRDTATPREIARRVLRSVRPGSVVLLHDGGGGQSSTVAALPRIIRGIRAMGLELVAIPT